MLSNTPGLQRRSCALGPRRDAVSRLSRTCPTLRKRGRCRAHEVEERVRHAVVAAKESELHARATALYTLQRELLSSSSAAAPTDESTAAAAGNSSDNSDDDAATAIARLVDELKREPAYMHWNVEAEVEAQLVAQHVRRCPYAHRHVVDVARKRPRHEQQEQRQDDSDDSDDSSDGSSDDKHTRPRRGTSRQWDSERRRVFADMTPLQQCVVALLWQRSVCVPRRWLCDVHDAMTDAAEAALRARMTTTTSADNADSVCDDGARDELLDAYVQSDAFAAAVARAGDAAVRHVTCCPALGLVDVSALPQLVACITQQHSTSSSSSAAAAISSNNNNNERVHEPIITHATWSHFVAAASSSSSSSPLCLFARALSEKEVDLSNDAVAAELVEVLAWMLHVFAREGDDDGDGNNARASIAAAAAETPPTIRLQHARSASASSIHSSNSAALSWRMLVAQRCQMRSADGLVSALHKRRLAADLLALDLSSNHLTSLRFLFALRAYCAQRLLRLSLRDNAITRKPEYVEQVRRCLPRLTSLDGRPIRRPALRLPRPCACACSLQALCRHDDNNDNDNVNNDNDDAAVASMCVRKADALRPSLRADEAACVVDCVARLLYIWETRRVPHTAREVRAAAAAAAAEQEEEELHEDNFWHRYLHPSATLTFSTAAQWSPYDAATMRTERDVDNDNDNNNTAAAVAVMRTTYGDIDGDGMHDDDDDKNEHRGAHGRSSSSSSGGGAVMVLSAADVRDVRIFDVAMRAGARNLLAGRAALSRVARGARDCFTAYQCTLYPPSLRVCHHLRAATMAVHKLVDHNNSNNSSDTTMTRRPTLYLVTLHGVMTWQLPSMRAGECIAATYDRTMTFVVTQLPRTAQRAWERRRSPPLQLYSDHVLLRPCSFAAAMATAAAAAQPRSRASIAAPPASPSLSGVVYSAQTRARVLRLTIEFGLEACDDGVALVCAVVERCTSDAAEHAALDALVYGPPPAAATTTTTSGAVEHNRSNDDNSDVEVVPAHVQRANAAVTTLLQRYMRECRRRARAAKRNDNDDDDEQDDARVFCVYSLLDRTASSSSAAAAAAVCGVSALHALLPPLPDMPCNNSSDACKATATTTLAHDDNNNNNGSSNTPRTRRTLTMTSDGWGATLHRVPMRLVNAVTRVMNAHYTLHACTRGAAS